METKCLWDVAGFRDMPQKAISARRKETTTLNHPSARVNPNVIAGFPRHCGHDPQSPSKMLNQVQHDGCHRALASGPVAALLNLKTFKDNP